MPRIARVVAANYPHHVTQRGNNRADVFFDDEDRHCYLQILQRYSGKSETSIWAYCLMSNHVHLLVVPKKAESLAMCIGRTNLTYTQYINRKYKKSGRLWQNRFFSTTVDTDQYLWAAVRYIELNPIKAHLVKEPQNYDWSSCRFTLGIKRNSLVRTHEWLNNTDRTEYIKFLGQTDTKTEAKIRQATSTGRPLGDDTFLKKLEKNLSRQLLRKKAGRPRKSIK